MRYYLDTEFIERGHEYPIELISIGLVAEDGRELYAVLEDGWSADHASDWVKANVLPRLGELPRVTRADLAWEVFSFVGERPEFWAYYADYDWVIFCQLFGSMVDLPQRWPMFCRDVMQLSESLGFPTLPRHDGQAHNALADAIHVKRMHEFLMRLKDGAARKGGG